MVANADSVECAAMRDVEVSDSPMRMGARARDSTADIAVDTAPPRICPAPMLPPKKAWSTTVPVRPAAVDATPRVIEN